MNCTVYGTLNAIETMFKRIFNVEENYSERYTGVLAGTTQGGNSPHKVAETIRKTGVIADRLLPFQPDINEWDEFYSPKPMDPTLQEIGTGWLRAFDFKHEWVFTPSMNLTPKQKAEKIREALKYSPVAVSVSAWRQKGDVYVKDVGEPDNHWCMLYAPDMVFDSYDNTKKRLEPNYDHQFAKIYYLAKRDIPAAIAPVGFFHRLLDKLKSVLRLGHA